MYHLPVCHFLSELLGTPPTPYPGDVIFEWTLIVAEIYHPSLKLSLYLKSVIFHMKLHVINSLDIKSRSVLTWHLDVCKSSVYMTHLMLFLPTHCFIKVEKQHQFDRVQKMHVTYSFWFSLRQSHRCFGIAGPRFLLEVALTMISKRFC